MSHKDKDSHEWRMGYTTGSCAAGAAKAACLQLKNELKQITVEIPLPSGERLNLPLKWVEKESVWGNAGIIKDAGDDPDVTHGLEIQAKVRVLSNQGEIHIRGGKGVGIVTKKGLQVPTGESAINPVPQQMIRKAIREVFPEEEIEVIIEAPEGERIAQHTLNPRLGIVGGISILGTTGIVRPMSEEAFKNSILPELDQAIAYGHQTIILTPGHYGFRTATEKLKIPAEAVIQMSNFVGFILEEAAYRKIKNVILLGHIGKLLKVAGGIFHTHNHVADARMEILVAHAALHGISLEQLRSIAEFPTAEGAATELISLGEQDLIHEIAALVSRRAMEHVQEKVKVGTVLTLLDGSFIGWDDTAQQWIQSKWQWPHEYEF
ncbi:cobalt-precorrin-6A synthase [Desulfitobacterium metallireducens DSM 15288]|uniref:Cobalt-precorrin-5B C(1)-methyltransferase n=2 Tax=Desulfitobacterium TaxID=36853 RepID=W0E6C4_9FIRM|nr:cobalt-precorrin-6A synthase [Desulfitobacterium metallireducens DSM 15288]